MTKTKSTKRSLIMSLLSLLICVTMLIGTTYAWFTDSVTSAGNIIKSGNLDVTMEWKDATATGAQQTYKDASAGPIFNYDLWEPGYVEAKNIKISNVGTLALKYKLNILPNGIVSELANVIDVYFAKGELTLANREMLEIKKLGTLAEVLAGMPANASGELEATKSDIITIALKMQESAGNEYQNLSIGSNFAVQLLATQLTSEYDSFDNQYDVNAAYSLWDGTVPAEMPETLVVDGATQTVYVKDAAAFAYLNTLSAKWAELYTDGNGTTYTNYANGAGANYYYSGKWTVSLETDIDLNNHAITPVSIVLGQSTGATAFKGNNHVIRNINTTTGLFAANTRAAFSDLALENVKATNGALSATANHSISNVSVKKAKISGTDYVGGLVGRAFGNVSSCKVIDSVVIASGKEAGGLIGYAETNSKGSTITSNTVKNVTVYANNRAAGLVAQPNVNIKVYNNTIDTVTVGAVDTTTYKADAVASNALAPENVYNNTVKSCTVDNGNTAEIVDDASALKEALKNGTDVIYAEDVVVEGTSQLNTGATIVGATFKNENGTAVTQTVSGTFKDCVFEGSEALRWCYSNAGETVVFENCVIKTDFRGVHFDNMKGDVIFKNCEINGFNAIGGAGTVTFENCTFGNDKSSYNGLNMYSNINLINCTFNYVSGKTNFIDMEGTGKTLAITNCKAYLDGVETDISNFVGGSKLSQNTVVYN